MAFFEMVNILGLKLRFRFPLFCLRDLQVLLNTTAFLRLFLLNTEVLNCWLTACPDYIQAYATKISKDQLTKTTAQALACTVTTTWFGFYRLWRGSGIIFDTVELYLPKYSYESQVLYGCHNEFVTFDNHITGSVMLNIQCLYIYKHILAK